MEMSTRELFECFRQTEVCTKNKNMENMMNALTPEMFEEYEDRVGKPFVEMNEDEAIGLLAFLVKKTGRKAESALPRVTNILRGMADYYIRNVKPIVSPIPRIIKNRDAILAEASQGAFRMSEKYMHEIIGKLYQTYTNDFAEFTELYILLFYCGIPSTAVLGKFKVPDFDSKNMVIHGDGRDYHLSKRCAYLLSKHLETYEISNGNRNYYLVGWRGSLIKTIRRSPDSIDNIGEYEYARMLTAIFSARMELVTNDSITARSLYFLGFHDHIVRSVGEERAAELFKTNCGAEGNVELRKFANDYGVTLRNITQIKEILTGIG